MSSENDERVKVFRKRSHGNYIVKKVDDLGLEDEVTKKSTLPLHLDTFVLSNSKRNMNIFIHVMAGFYTKDVHYTDTDSLYIDNKHWEELDEAALIGKNPLQGKIVYENGASFMVFFLHPR